MKPNKISTLFLLPLLLSSFLFAQSNNPVVIDIPGFEFRSSNLPLIFIDTHGQQIVDARRIPAHMGVIYHGPDSLNFLTDPFNDYDGQIGIELRGSTAQSFPKQPFRIETTDLLGNDINVSLLGMPEENDWVLHNPFSDKTLIRNVLAYKIARDMGWYASRTKLCEVFVNGSYEGVYVLMEKIKRDKNRVNIAQMDSTDISGDNLTGGYIIKIDKLDGEQTGGWTSKEKVYYQYHYPKPSDILPEQKQYIQNYMDSFESLMNSPGFAHPDTGYSKFIDLASFVDFFIINELSRNIDGYRLSTFMYKDLDSKGGKLTMGPVWDFNLAFGNANYYDGYRVEGWNLDVLTADNFQDGFGVPFWWKKIGSDPAFKEKVAERWWGLRPDVLHEDSLLQFIANLADTLDGAQKRNYLRWPALQSYVWPNKFIGWYYEEEIQFVKEWLYNRIQWMDANLPREKIITSVSINETLPSDFYLEQNYPNPFNSGTTIRFFLKKDESVSLEIYNSLGQIVRTLVDDHLPAGWLSLRWDGKDEFGNAVASGIYSCRLCFENAAFSRKMLLIE